jgi:hypothetical protein
MTNIIKTTGAGITRIFRHFTRRSPNKTPWRASKWHDCDVSSRGL